MEDEARTILLAALNASEHLPGDTLYDRIRARFAPLGGIDLELPERQPAREPPHFDN
jgi:plasmid stability protein